MNEDKLKVINQVSIWIVRKHNIFSLTYKLDTAKMIDDVIIVSIIAEYMKLVITLLSSTAQHAD